MYEIAVESHFDAAHFLRGYRGRCEALHGHRFVVVLRVRASRLNDIGIACDFADLKQHLADVLAGFDHVCLNDVPPFDKINPSSENIAARIHEQLRGKLAALPVSIAGVEVWESPQTRVTYTPD